MIAAALGAGLFPSVSPFAFADLSGAERAVIGGALGRALVTRGVLDQVDGRLVPGADPSIGLLDLAVRPDLLVEISHAATSAPTMRALCLRADAMVLVEPCGPFGRRISNADAARLVDEATDVVTSALAHGDGEVTARATWRDGDGVLATELTWAPGDVVSSDEIRAALLAHLPGAEPAL